MSIKSRFPTPSADVHFQTIAIFGFLHTFYLESSQKFSFFPKFTLFLYTLARSRRSTKQISLINIFFGMWLRKSLDCKTFRTISEEILICLYLSRSFAILPALPCYNSDNISFFILCKFIWSIRSVLVVCGICVVVPFFNSLKRSAINSNCFFLLFLHTIFMHFLTLQSLF